MPQSYVPSLLTSEKQDKLAAGVAHVTFEDFFDKELRFYPLSGFKPLRLSLKTTQRGRFPSIVALEYAKPPFRYNYGGKVIEGVNFCGKDNPLTIFAREYAGVENPTLKMYTIPEWTSSGIVLIGSTGIVADNLITFLAQLGQVDVIVHADGTYINQPVFRLRRSYDTLVEDEVVGTGDGTTLEFDIALENFPICPGSIKITFIDTVLRTAKIRDDGYGHLGTIPEDMFTLSTQLSYIDYKTGKGKLFFNVDHAPADIEDILADYEYDSSGFAEENEYEVIWSTEQ